MGTASARAATLFRGSIHTLHACCLRFAAPVTSTRRMTRYGAPGQGLPRRDSHPLDIASFARRPGLRIGNASSTGPAVPPRRRRLQRRPHRPKTGCLHHSPSRPYSPRTRTSGLMLMYRDRIAADSLSRRHGIRACSRARTNTRHLPPGTSARARAQAPARATHRARARRGRCSRHNLGGIRLRFEVPEGSLLPPRRVPQHCQPEPCVAPGQFSPHAASHRARGVALRRGLLAPDGAGEEW